MHSESLDVAVVVAFAVVEVLVRELAQCVRVVQFAAEGAGVDVGVEEGTEDRRAVRYEMCLVDPVLSPAPALALVFALVQVWELCLALHLGHLLLHYRHHCCC